MVNENLDHKVAHVEKQEGDKLIVQKEDQGELFGEVKPLETGMIGSKSGNSGGHEGLANKLNESRNLGYKAEAKNLDTHVGMEDMNEEINDNRNLEPEIRGKELINDQEEGSLCDKVHESLPEARGEKTDSDDLSWNMNEDGVMVSKTEKQKGQATENIPGGEKEAEPVFYGTEVPGMETYHRTSNYSLDSCQETEGSAWPEKAAALKNFVREKSAVAVSSVLRRLSGKGEEYGQETQDVPVSESKPALDSIKDTEVKELPQKAADKSVWNPLAYIMMYRDDLESKGKQREDIALEVSFPIAMKGRVILYTRLGCQSCRQVRLFLHRKRLRYVEINIDVYPGRKAELEKFTGSSAVPKVLFNEVVIGGLNELIGLEEAGKLGEKLDYLIAEAPSTEAPLPPFPGEDDGSNDVTIDELAVIVKKMKESVVVKDRFYKMRRFTNCFLGSEAVDFLSEEQYLEREEAVELGRKLASKHFFRNVLDENLFEDGSYVYRFLDDDPVVSSQCYNIPRGIIDASPKPISEIASKLHFLLYAIFEAYASEDGKHVDYRSIHGSEEFARYLRTVEELQRVELKDMRREDKLAFSINLYNIMAIHAILEWGHPAGPLERRKMLGDFKYVIGGCTFSLSDIHNGILRANQRPPYNLMKSFNTKDERLKMALPYPEPLIHFTLVCGTRSGPALRCYSPGNIDKELMEAARSFLRGGGIILDPIAKVASVSKILRWFSVDFGNNEVEVLKHASNYLEPAASECLLELLANNQLKVTYQPYDWGLNI